MSTQTDTRNEQDHNGNGTADDWLEGIAAFLLPVLAAAMLLPLALAVWVAPPLSRHRWLWRREGTAFRLALIIVGLWAAVSAAAAYLWWWPKTLAVFQEGWTAEALLWQLVAAWVLLLPFAVVLLWSKMPDIARRCAEGSLKPEIERSVTAAIESAAEADTRTGLQHLPATVGGQPVLAAVLDTERRSVSARAKTGGGRNRFKDSALIRKKRRPLRPGRPLQYLTAPAIPIRLIVLAGSGKGKTVAQTHLIRAQINSGIRQLFIDGKGILKDAHDIARLAEQCGVRPDQIRVWPRDAYAGWNGTPDQIKNKVMKMFPPVEGGAMHYRNNDQRVLSLATAATAKPPRSSVELLHRLQVPADYLDQTEFDEVRAKSKVSDTHGSIQAVLDGVSPLIDGNHEPRGWSLHDNEDDWRVAVVSVASDDEVRAAAFILADLHMIATESGQRSRTQDSPALQVYIDEAARILDQPASPDLAGSLETYRGKNIGLVLAGQSVESLGDRADRMLKAGVSLWVGCSADPDAIVQFAGTKARAEAAFGFEDDDNPKSRRLQQQFALDPNWLRTAPPGQFAVVEFGIGHQRVIFPPA